MGRCVTSPCSARARLLGVKQYSDCHGTANTIAVVFAVREPEPAGPRKYMQKPGLFPVQVLAFVPKAWSHKYEERV
jgi:hypothetical protein